MAPARDFFSIVATLTGLLWVSLIVESQLRIDALIDSAIPRIDERLQELRSQLRSLRADEQGIKARTDALFAMITTLDKQGKRTERAVEEYTAEVEALQERCTAEMVRQFGTMGGNPQASSTGQELEPEANLRTASDHGEASLAAHDILFKRISDLNDKKLQKLLIDQGLMNLANILGTLAAIQLPLIDRVRSLGADLGRMKLLARARSAYTRWVPVALFAAGGWTEITALTALYGFPTVLEAKFVISGLAVFGSAFAGVTLFRPLIGQTASESLRGRTRMAITYVLVAIVLAAPIVVGIIYVIRL